MGTPNYRIEKHVDHFAKGEECILCHKNTPPKPVSSFVSYLGTYKVTAMNSDEEGLEHLSCHPEQPYHHKCLKTWLKENDSCCPIDYRINKFSPLANTLSEMDLKIKQIAMRFFPIYAEVEECD